MKREAAQAGGNIAVVGGDTNQNVSTSTTLVSKKLSVQDPVTAAIAAGR